MPKDKSKEQKRIVNILSGEIVEDEQTAKESIEQLRETRKQNDAIVTGKQIGRAHV